MLLMTVLFPIPAAAVPAITCHCFTDRTYDPAHPALADPYFLATTQNSFFAVIFKVDKKTIVMKKQQGTDPDDLWIAYLVAAKSGMSPDVLLRAKQNTGAWNDVITPLRLSAETLGHRFSQALKAAAAATELGAAVVDEQVLRSQLLRENELTALRRAGASSQELIIAAVIAARLKQSARQLYLDVRGGTKTWGALLREAQINPKEMQRDLAAIVKQ